MAALPTCRFVRHYEKDNLNHDVSFGKKAKRNLFYTPFDHFFVAIPLICKKSVDNRITSPSGAEASPIYADNIKYLNLMSAEEFGATIEAYMYPDEFAECDGSVEVVPGMFAGPLFINNFKPVSFSSFVFQLTSSRVFPTFKEEQK